MRRSIALFVVTAVGFGTAFVGIKTGLAEIPPVLFAALRFDLGAVVIAAALAVTGRLAWPRTRADYYGIAVTGVFLTAINGGLLFVGQQFTTTGAAATMYSLIPVVSPLFAVLLIPGATVRRSEVAGIALGFVGVLIVIRPDPADLAAGTVGQALIVGSAMSAALGSVLVRRYEPDILTLPRTVWAFLLGGGLLHVASLGLGEPQAVGLTPELGGVIAYVAVPSTAVAFSAYFALIDAVGPVRANLVAYVSPGIAALTGWAVLGETVSPWTVVGFCVVFAGFALVGREELLAALRRRRGADAATGAGTAATDGEAVETPNPDPGTGPDGDPEADPELDD